MILNGHSIFVKITVLTINRCGYILFDWWWPAVDTTESVGDDHYPLREVIRTNQYNDMTEKFEQCWFAQVTDRCQRAFCGLRRVFLPLVLIQGGLWRARQIWWPLYSAKVPRYIRRFRRKSWQNVFVETSAAKVCFHLRAMSGFWDMYDFRGMKLSGSIFVQDFRNSFICAHGRRCILHAMRKRFQAWLEMRRFRKSFLWFFVAGVVFGEFGLCFEQIWTARGHRFVNICYFSACHDFAWQVQDSARFRMPQAHFSWEAKNSQNLMVLSCIVFHIFNVHVSWWMHNWFCGAVLILISLAQPSPHSVCVWKSWKDVERLPLIASLLVVWFIGFAVS